jgi:hypothetical protein
MKLVAEGHFYRKRGRLAVGDGWIEPLALLVQLRFDF